MIPKAAKFWLRQLTRPALFAPTIVAIALVLGWWLVSQVMLNPERLRAEAEAYVTERTGLPATIEKVSVHLLPTPSIRLSGVHVGEPGFEARADSLVAIFRLERLGEGVLDIPNVIVKGAVATLDDWEEWPARWDKLRGAIQGTAREPTEARFSLVIGEIVAEGAELYHGRSGSVAALGDVRLHNVLDPQRTVEIREGRLPLFGRRARFAVDAQVEADPNTRRVEAVHGVVHTYALSFLPERLEALEPLFADLRVTFESESGGATSMRVHGETRPPPGQLIGSPLAGMVNAQAWWDEGELILNDIHWRTRRLQLEADGVRGRDGVWAVAIPSLTADARALTELGGVVVPEGVTVEPAEEGRLTVQDALLGYDDEFGLDWIKGRARFEGIDVALDDGEQAFTGLSGDISVDKNLFTLEKIEGDGVFVTGSVDYDAAHRSAAAMLSGHVDLSPARLVPYVKTDAIEALSGRLTVSRLSGTFQPGHGVPADLWLEGAFNDGGMTLNFGGATERFSAVQASFTSDGEVVSTEIWGRGEAVGAMRIEGRYDTVTRRWTGWCDADLLAVAKAYNPAAVESEWLGPALAYWSNGELALDMTLPSGDSEGLEFEAAHTASPVSRVAVRMERQEGRFTLAALDGDGTLPARLWNERLPAGWRADGNVALNLSAAPGRDLLEAGLDFDGVELYQGRWLDKPAGVPAAVRLYGRTADGWRIERGEAVILGQELELAWRPDSGFNVPLQTLDLQRLAEVSPALAETAGAAEFAMESEPFSMAVQLTGASAQTVGGVHFETLEGGIHWDDGGLAIDGFRVRGHDSDLLMSLHLQDRHINGTIQGRQANADALAEAWDRWREEEEEDAAGHAAAEPHPPVTADIGLELDRLLYRRAELGAVSAVITADAETVRIDDFRCQPYSGWLLGQAHWARTETPREIHADFELDSAHARLFDDLFFEEPRGFTGVVSGDMTFQIPLDGDGEPAAAASGYGRLRARDGSFGRLGLATRILAVLRTTEIFRLRAPNLRDDGLLYDEFHGRFNMNQGLIHITQASLRSPSLALDAAGRVDLGRDAMDVGIKAHPFESVTGIADQAPIIGPVINEVRQYGGLYLRATGRPGEPRVRIESAGVVERLLDSLPRPRR